MNRLKLHAAMFAIIIGLLTTFTQTARAESWSWENLFSFGSSENAAAPCVTDPVVSGGNLEQAVIDACPGSTISFNGSFSVSEPIVIDKNLTLAGGGIGATSIYSINTRAIDVYGGVTVVISGMTIHGVWDYDLYGNISYGERL